MSFAHYQAHSSPLFKNLNMLKLTDIVKNSNLLFTHNTINKNSPAVFDNYFLFDEASHPHQTINRLTSTYSIPTGSLKLPIYRTDAGKSSIKYICSNTWNSILKVLSTANIKKYNQNPFWMNKTSINTFKYILKKPFLECYWSLKINHRRDNIIYLSTQFILIEITFNNGTQILLVCFYFFLGSTSQTYWLW